MRSGKPKLFIDEFVGISNRLETLPLAFAIREAFGHQIILDWHELDSFSVSDTARGRVRLLARLGARRIRHCDRATFDSIDGQKVILRSLDGPAELLDPIYLQTAQRLHLHAPLRDVVKATFTRVAGRPMVGVHVRHGDFLLADENVYRNDLEFPAVPFWWYAQTMRDIQRVQPDVVFFLSCTGDPGRFVDQLAGLDVLTLDAPSHYGYKGKDHDSEVNPVADIFALACCPILLATPISGYSHWAANALGEPTDCLLPLPGATREQPTRGLLRMHGARLPRWRAAARTGAEIIVLGEGFGDIDFSRSANTEWL